MYRAPLIEELDTNLSPLLLFELFRQEHNCFFMDSAMESNRLGRYSIMGSRPFLTIKSHGDNVTIDYHDHKRIEKGNPIDVLSRYLEEYRLDFEGAQVPFIGGAVGYFSYDICHFIERLPALAADDLQLPECWFGFYDFALVCDNLSNKTYLVSTGFPELGEEQRIKKAKERVNEFKSHFKQFCYIVPFDNLEPKKCYGSLINQNLKGNFTHDEYIKAVQKARQYIINGDIFEVNLSQRFEVELSVLPYELYLRLRQINPAPFAAYMDCGEVIIASASPERFLRCDGDTVETRPIKGTKRRGATLKEDAIQADALMSSVKDHAENMMIVDLERNDLGRVCRYGSVKVTELAVLEKFPTVFHLTSTVVGRLRSDKSRIDLLKATMPGGSITGAPKIRSMEIIDELEPTRRSVYTGNIGYLSFGGSMDFNIVIRTFLIKGRKAYFQVGGAVVYDSDPEAEYRETLDKGFALMQALNIK